MPRVEVPALVAAAAAPAYGFIRVDGISDSSRPNSFHFESVRSTASSTSP
jgi:hypothetical protein